MASTWVCYCLAREDSGATYIGATINMAHRIRQHNGEIKGGAHYTTSALAKGHSWNIVCTVGPFPNSTAALQFEWRWKHISRKIDNTPILRRIIAVIRLLNMDKPTSKAELYNSYPRLNINIYKRCPETETLFTNEILYGSPVYYDAICAPQPPPLDSDGKSD